MSNPPWLPFIPFLKKHKKHTTVVYTKSCFMRPTRKIDWFHPQKDTCFTTLLRLRLLSSRWGEPTFQPTAQPQVLPNAHRIHHRLSTSQWDRPWPLLKMVQAIGKSPGVGRYGRNNGIWYEVLKLKHLQNTYDGWLFNADFFFLRLLYVLFIGWNEWNDVFFQPLIRPSL